MYAILQHLRRLVLVYTFTKASQSYRESSMKDISVTPHSFNTSRQYSGRVLRYCQTVDLVNIERLVINM
jgi:hypothetical protein